LNVLSAQPSVFQRPCQDGKQVTESERLENVIGGPTAQRLHSGVDGAITRHDHSRQVAIDLLRGAQQGDAIHLGHHQVGEQEVELTLA
jgi:hypothetical protein